MSESKTAIVETLTAEVYALMVGSRQITMSVFEQLDIVDMSKIEPFGRTRPKGSMNRLYVVGRSKDTGALVSSYTYNPKPLPSQKGCGDEWMNDKERVYKKAFNEWSELPLIVLAGLR